MCLRDYLAICLWTLKRICMKLGMYITEKIYHLNSILHKSFSSVCVFVCTYFLSLPNECSLKRIPPFLARQRLGNNFPMTIKKSLRGRFLCGLCGTKRNFTISPSQIILFCSVIYVSILTVFLPATALKVKSLMTRWKEHGRKWLYDKLRWCRGSFLEGKIKITSRISQDGKWLCWAYDREPQECNLGTLCIKLKKK
jgi:hypothetical protein